MKAWYSDGWAASHTPLLQQHQEPQHKVRFSHLQGKESTSEGVLVHSGAIWLNYLQSRLPGKHSLCSLFVVTADLCWPVFSSPAGCVAPSFQTRRQLSWFLLKICFPKQNEPEKCPYIVSTHEVHVGNTFIMQLLFLVVIQGVRVSMTQQAHNASIHQSILLLNQSQCAASYDEYLRILWDMFHTVLLYVLCVTVQLYVYILSKLLEQGCSRVAKLISM